MSHEHHSNIIPTSVVADVPDPARALKMMTSHLEALATMSMTRLAHYHQQQRDAGRSNETEHEGSLIEDDADDDDDDNLNLMHADDGWLWDLMQRTNEVVALLQQIRPPLEAPLAPRPADDPPA